MGVTLAPTRFLPGRFLMLAFLAILLQRDLVNLFGSPIPLPVLALSLVVIVSICAVYAWFWLRVAGSDDNRRATVALVLLTGLVTAFTWIDPNRSYPFYYPYYYCAIVAGAAYPWRRRRRRTTQSGRSIRAIVLTAASGFQPWFSQYPFRDPVVSSMSSTHLGPFIP